MEHRRHPDLHVRLMNPNEARVFIDDPETHYPRAKPKAVYTNRGFVPLNTQELTDQLAVEIAFILLSEYAHKIWINEAQLQHQEH